jgi:hypothetical protein
MAAWQMLESAPDNPKTLLALEVYRQDETLTVIGSMNKVY